MNWAYAHLLLNHLPVLGSFLGLGLLLAGLVRRSPALSRAALWTLLATALLGIATFWTGERAEELVEELPGVEHELIHEHEEAAEQARIAFLAAGALALAALVFRREGAARRALLGLTLVVALVAAVLLARAANLGGPIRHPEIRSGAPGEGATG
jgi:uncharacterized membrane protein